MPKMVRFRSMSASFVIRAAAAGDVPGIARLVGEYWRFESIAGFAAQAVEPLLDRVLSEPGLGRIWVAERGGELTGYLVAVYVFSLEQQGLMAEIDEFFVLPAARACGTGAALLSMAEAELAGLGCVCLQLQLSRDNARAREFYRRRGYRERDGYELLDKRLTV
jgi:aminoglycoside 6'-N-acetyltransferase I